MRVVFDFDPVLVDRFSGFYSYGTGLLEGFEALAERPEFILFYSKRLDKQAERFKERFHQWARFRPIPVKIRWLKNLWRYSSYPKLKLLTGEFDIYHCFHNLMPPTDARPRVMTVHDLRRYMLPQLYSKSKLKHFELAVRRADHFITVSQSTKNDLCKVFGIPQDRIDVVHLAAGAEFMPFPADKRQQVKADLARQTGASLHKYLLVFSSPDSRKNIWRIIQAFKSAQSQLQDDTRLVVIGNLPRHNTGCRGQGISPDDENVLFVGAVSNVAEWIACAEGLVFASLYEGFGIPILEAFACGVPVITSNVSSMPEVAAEAALLVDPYEQRSISQAIVDICTDNQLRNRLVQAGLNRNREFSWPKTAAKTLDVYKKLA